MTRRPLTAVADDADGRRREEEDPLPQQREAPDREDLLTEELEELVETAGRVGHLRKKRNWSAEEEEELIS